MPSDAENNPRCEWVSLAYKCRKSSAKFRCFLKGYNGSNSLQSHWVRSYSQVSLQPRFVNCLLDSYTFKIAIADDLDFGLPAEHWTWVLKSSMAKECRAIFPSVGVSFLCVRS